MRPRRYRPGDGLVGGICVAMTFMALGLFEVLLMMLGL